MTPDDLSVVLARLTAGTLYGRHVYGVACAVPPLPAGLRCAAIDGQSFLAERDWAAGTAERGHEVAEALAGTLLDAAGGSSEPLLFRIDAADALIGEIGSLAPLFDQVLGDNRALLFCLAPAPNLALFAGVPPQLRFEAGAAARRLNGEFGEQVVEPVGVVADEQ